MPANDDVVNLKELKEIMSDDTELIQECFQDFLNDWPGQYVDIKEAVLKNDANRLDESAHKLKGTLRYLAADSAAKAAFALEAAGKNGDLAGADEKLKQLESECKRLVRYIHSFKP